MTAPTNQEDEQRQALVNRFTQDMRHGIEVLTRLGYPATQFKIMVERDGAISTAIKLIRDKVPSYGLWRLKELGRLDMSVEMWVLLPWYEPLFDPELRALAERKLRLFEVDVDRELRLLIDRQKTSPD